MNEFPVSYLNGSELLTISGSFVSILNSIPSSSDQVRLRLIEFLENDNIQLSKALSRNTYGKKIDTEDALFDQSFITFRNFCVLMSKQDNQKEIADAASELVSLIKTVDWNLNKRSFARELAGAKAITDKLSNEAYTTILNTCNATVWYEQFLTCYNNLKAAFTSRIEEVAQSTADIIDIKDAKVNIKLHLGQAYNYIGTLNTIDPSSYGQYVSKMEEVILAVLPGIRARKTRSQNETEKEKEEIQVEANT